ncbi:formimidoylglutamase [Flagellimonas allohymeniacidonis]|uniref:Formimidoylglutamase n=1 Tax=Flagellimonas allohymeniacidonis TaxID=2517819 RepID=A0A4Q8QA61_9FLAO|nr:formimidoylglutamase [Allomuricauda hymeniacidonis]TAI47182.1 formimidoylglutamase [Allomuricauda hymeniacidonis]
MKNYASPNAKIWTGRTSDEQLYLHEKIQCIPLDEITWTPQKSIALLGYACDEGVRRNQGRVGTVNGPKSIKSSFGKLPNHLSENVLLYDIGDIVCVDGDMESAQDTLAQAITSLLQKKQFPIILGGSHDVAYGHYQGIHNYVSSKNKKHTIGIINFDAHFDLRKNMGKGNSGTPFYQIAMQCKEENRRFEYLCLGIRKDANDRLLFQAAKDLEANYVLSETFQMPFLNEINTWINAFIQNVDHVYVTIDLDGFSSAYAPGVSAPSPVGFTPYIVQECLKTIINSRKLISMDVAEMNPKYDIDNQTSKLAASLVHHVIHTMFQV